MQTQHLTAALISLLSLTSAAPTLEARLPTMGGFTLSQSSQCPSNLDPTTTSARINIILGGACGKCTSLSWGGPFKTIQQSGIDVRCQITLFNTEDCSNGGVVTGPNCWAPEGGIKAYKVDCPWWNDNPNSGLYQACMQ